MTLKSCGRNTRTSLKLMERYHFFSSSCRQFHLNYKSLSESESDENELDGALARALRVLKKIHGQFFDNENGDNYACNDVRRLLISHSTCMLKKSKRRYAHKQAVR